MACKLGSCVVHEYKIDPKPDPAAAPGAGIEPTRAVKVLRDNPTDGPLIDSSETSPEKALLAQLKKDMKEAQEAECGPNCLCVKQEGQAGVSSTYEVPVGTRYRTTTGQFMRTEGTIRVTVTDVPGKCFTNHGVFLASAGRDFPERDIA